MKIISRKEAQAQGLKRYFTGKPCKRGHVAERKASSGTCVECNRQYREENREERLEKKRQYYAENRERMIEKMRQYHAENRDKELERNRKYYAENRGRALEKMRQWREENPEYNRQHREENGGLYRAIKAKRRAAKLDRTLSHAEDLTQFAME